MKINRIKEKMLDLVFPPFACCLGCGDKRLTDQRDHLCLDCRKALSKNNQGQRSLSLFYIDRCIIPFSYQGVAKTLVHNLKYQQIKASAAPLVQAMAQAMGEEQIDGMMPVPLYKKRQRQRGFNQAMVLCRGLGELKAIPLIEEGLVRTRNTAQQAKLNKEERKKNVEGAFEGIVDFTGKNILLVDDVLTTGATASACAKALKKAGASKVYLITAAYAPLVTSNKNQQD